MTADDQTRRPRVGRADLIAGPDPRDLLQHRVQPAPPAGQLNATRLVVVIATAEADAEREATAGDGVEAECLLGELDGVAPEWSKRDERTAPDPLGNSRRRREGDQRLVVVIDDAIDRPE